MCMLVWGRAKPVKMGLLCQIAHWAMERILQSGFARNVMLPVLLEGDFICPVDKDAGSVCQDGPRRAALPAKQVPRKSWSCTCSNGSASWRLWSSFPS